MHHLHDAYLPLPYAIEPSDPSAYVNNLRLTHYDQYQASHPAETKESAALASGFSSYNACYRAQQKLKK